MVHGDVCQGIPGSQVRGILFLSSALEVTNFVCFFTYSPFPRALALAVMFKQFLGNTYTFQHSS